MVELATDMKDERPNYQRGVQIIVYSMNGGPIPTRAVAALKAEARKVAEAFPAIAITVVEE